MKPIRTGRGKGNPNRASKATTHTNRSDERIEGYPAGHILSKQNDCLIDRRGSHHRTAVESAALRCYGSEIFDESVETHIVPRQSTTLNQHLQIIPAVQFDTVDLRYRQLEKTTDDKGNTVIVRDALGKLKMVSGTNKRALNGKFVKDSRNLLNTGNPFADASLKLKRMRSRSKRIGYDLDVNFDQPKQNVGKTGEIVLSSEDTLSKFTEIE